MKRLAICLALAMCPQSAWAQSQELPGVLPAVTLAPAHPEAAPVALDPITVVKTFYPLRAEARELPFSARLQRLLEAADLNSKRLNAPVAGLDFAFQVNAQNTEDGYEKTLKFSPRRNDGKRTRVRVSLRNYRNVQLAFDMVFENGRWLVDDVSSIREPRWVLSRLFLIGAREK